MKFTSGGSVSWRPLSITSGWRRQRYVFVRGSQRLSVEVDDALRFHAHIGHLEGAIAIANDRQPIGAGRHRFDGELAIFVRQARMTGAENSDTDVAKRTPCG